MYYLIDLLTGEVRQAKKLKKEFRRLLSTNQEGEERYILECKN